MKRFVAITLSLVLVAALLVSCAAPAPEPAAEEPAAEEPVAEEPAEEPAAEEPAEEPAEEEPSEEPVEEEPAEEEPAEEPAGEVQDLTIGFYADAADSYYQILYETMQKCADEDPDTNWNIDFKVGQSTADEQLRAVEDFITAGYDAIVVIQNNPNTTSECIAKASEAGIPYFGACHDFSEVDNANDSAGSVGYNFYQSGVYAGEDALERGVTRIVNIEGVLGQGTAAAQTLGIMEAYEEAGKHLGGPTGEDIATKKTEVDLDGEQEIEIVFWASGNWMAEPAQTAMADAITSLGPDGFDGIYVHNDPMAEGIIAAMEEAGLDTADYWIGASNGREIAWDWVKEQKITMDVNQPASLEGDALYQQVKAYFNGEDFRAHLHPYLTPFNVDNIDEIETSLVPVTDVAAYMEGRATGNFVTDINDPKFTDIEGFNK